MTDEQGEQPSSTSGGADVGSVAEEAAKLMGALRGWAADAGADQWGESLRGLGAHVDDRLGHDQDCRYCPLCIGVNKARQLSPEVREHLADAMTSAVQALAAAVREMGAPGASTSPSVPTRIDLDE